MHTRIGKHTKTDICAQVHVQLDTLSNVCVTAQASSKCWRKMEIKDKKANIICFPWYGVAKIKSQGKKKLTQKRESNAEMDHVCCRCSILSSCILNLCQTSC